LTLNRFKYQGWKFKSKPDRKYIWCQGNRSVYSTAKIRGGRRNICWH